MDVLKRSEFCGVSKVKKAGLVTKLRRIKPGAVFSAKVDGCSDSYVWIRTNDGCVRMEQSGIMDAGCHCTVEGSRTVEDYEALNATLVIDD